MIVAARDWNIKLLKEVISRGEPYPELNYDRLEHYLVALYYDEVKIHESALHGPSRAVDMMTNSGSYTLPNSRFVHIYNRQATAFDGAGNFGSILQSRTHMLDWPRDDLPIGNWIRSLRYPTDFSAEYSDLMRIHIQFWADCHFVLGQMAAASTHAAYMEEVTKFTVWIRPTFRELLECLATCPNSMPIGHFERVTADQLSLRDRFNSRVVIMSSREYLDYPTDIEVTRAAPSVGLEFVDRPFYMKTPPYSVASLSTPFSRADGRDVHPTLPIPGLLDYSMWVNGWTASWPKPCKSPNIEHTTDYALGTLFNSGVDYDFSTIAP